MMKLGTGIAWSLVALCSIGSLTAAAEPRIEYFRLRAPGDAYDIQQGSDLYYGKLGERMGLWLVCDRNGRESAGKLYFLTARALQAAKPGGVLAADDEFTIVAPAGEWRAFAEANKSAGAAVLEEVRKRILPAADRGDEPFLDLEAIAVAPGLTGPAGDHVFVVAEEPFSTVLELTLEGQGRQGQARLVAAYAYAERPEEQGTARNDGLEALAYAGTPGRFYIGEEGTRKLNDEERSLLMYSLDPRLEAAVLKNARVEPEAKPSERLTEALRGCRRGRMQTINALTCLRDGRLLAVDRNGGWLDLVNPVDGMARPWLNLYDLQGADLRQVLAEFPRHRVMPYISIEGIAVDERGGVWLVDDPAMPEGWRESCLVRLSGYALK